MTIEDFKTCVRGCVRPRRHLTECEDPESCRGCEPRRADHGLLCWPCHRRFQLMLEQAEIAERWLTGNLPTGMVGRMKNDADSRGSHKEAPAPLSLAILDARQLLGDRLAAWADDLSQHSELKGPKRHGVEADANFLLTWISTVENLEWVGDWFEELVETMSDAHVLAPWRPAMTRLPKVPCPDCHLPSLAIFGGEEDAVCLECRMVITPARYGVWARAFEDGEDLGDTA